MSGVLDGLNVVDLATTPAGAPVGQLFADNGADVLMIEPPGGSPLRSMGAFPFWSRGKRSLVLDLATPDGLQQLRELIAAADVLVETFRPGQLEALGIGDPTALNPRLVHTSITGFGLTGPLKDIKGYEALVMAKIGGFTPWRKVTRRDGPTYVDVPYCTFSASQIALQGTLAALYERETSGAGQRVEASLAQAFAALDAWQWYTEVIVEKYPGAFTASEPYDDELVPNSGFPFKLATLLTKDGVWLQFAQVFPHLFDAFLGALGLAWMTDDPQWTGVPDYADRDKRIAFWKILVDKGREKTYAEWQEVFAADRNVFAEKFRAGHELLDHPQVLHDHLTIEVADTGFGTVRQPAPMIRLANEPSTIRSGSPALGEGGASSFAASSSSQGTGPSAGKPLAGVTVIEMAAMFAAPYAATLLTDLGARVIKIEPIRGDLIRHVQPFPDMAGMKPMQGKESIAVDLKSAEGTQIVLDLAARADLVLQSYRAGVGERLGVDVAALRRVNPRLVYLNAPGYGVDGPNADKPVFAPGIGAATGLARRNAGPAADPDPSMSFEEIARAGITLFMAGTPVSAQADGFSALGASVALVLGLYGRARGKAPESMVTSMLSTTEHALGDDMLEYDGRIPVPVPDPELFGLSAVYRLYRCGDGAWVFLAAPAADEWEPLATELGLDDDRFATPQLRAENDAALSVALAEIFGTRVAADWEQALTKVDVGCVVVNEQGPERTFQGALGHENGYVTTVETTAHGEMPRLAPLVRFSRSTTQAGGYCTLGEHTDAILAELGRSPEEISALREKGVIA